jgi:hypothetical protein
MYFWGSRGDSTPGRGSRDSKMPWNRDFNVLNGNALSVKALRFR